MPRVTFLFALLVVLGAVVGLTVARHAPPAAQPVDAPDDRFSAGRAMETLDALVGDGIPHPVESAHNAIVRERVDEHLRRAGWDPQLQSATVDRGDREIDVVNVLARLEGTGSGPAVMLSAHYDSVHEGPGAADDGVAVAAIIEVARILAGSPRPRNDVVVLITDGEEAGLLGARAFIDEHPWAGDIGVLVNLEARGTSGPSLMFETSADDAWLIDLLADVVARPRTASVFVEVYERMPNDTDFSIFRRHGMQGYNFAFIGDVEDYHTPNDKLDNVDPRSVQHHGDNMLALARALSEADLASAPKGRAIYFDLFAVRVVWWPAGLTPSIAIGAMLLVIVTAIVLHRQGRLGWNRWATATSTAPTVVIVALVAGVILHKTLVAAGALPAPWVDRPVLVGGAFWILACLVAAAAGLVAHRLGVWAIWAGTWTFWALLGVLLTVFLPGAAYLAVVPAGVAGLVGVAAASLARSAYAADIAVIAGAAATACLWFPLERLFYDALGFGVSFRHAGVAALFATTLIPAFARLASGGAPYDGGK